MALLYNMCGDIFFKGMTISEVFIKDPVTYLTTLVPLVAGLLLSITNKAKSAYIGHISMGTCYRIFSGSIVSAFRRSSKVLGHNTFFNDNRMGIFD